MDYFISFANMVEPFEKKISTFSLVRGIREHLHLQHDNLFDFYLSQQGLKTLHPKKLFILRFFFRVGIFIESILLVGALIFQCFPSVPVFFAEIQKHLPISLTQGYFPHVLWTVYAIPLFIFFLFLIGFWGEKIIFKIKIQKHIKLFASLKNIYTNPLSFFIMTFSLLISVFLTFLCILLPLLIVFVLPTEFYQPARLLFIGFMTSTLGIYATWTHNRDSAALLNRCKLIFFDPLLSSLLWMTFLGYISLVLIVRVDLLVFQILKVLFFLLLLSVCIVIFFHYQWYGARYLSQIKIVTQEIKLKREKILLEAVANGNVLWTAAALSLGSKHDLKDTQGDSLLHIAVKNDHKNLIYPLLKYGVDINITNKLFLTPLHIAASRANFAILKILVNSEADIHVKDIHGKTPLHRLCSLPSVVVKNHQEHAECVKLLLDQGLDPLEPDKQGVSAYENAKKWNTKDVITLMENKIDYKSRMVKNEQIES